MKKSSSSLIGPRVIIEPHKTVDSRIPAIKPRELYMAFFVVNKYTCTEIESGSRQSVSASAIAESRILIIIFLAIF